ncbi:MAG TPA: AAA family ATPase [Thermomicrobiales bacterium]|nr:AAA family ATPase [Thermomicrobiales bacterium]
MKRVVVIGAAGSGKTSLAAALARRLRAPHVELDALYWESNWAPTARETFRRRVEAALADETWVVDGNYSSARDVVWRRADTLVWLDYPLPVVLWRLARRSVTRIVRNDELWNGNRETLRHLLRGKDSLFVWAIQSHRRYRREHPALFTRPEHRHLRVLRFQSPSAATRWLAGLE